MLMPNAPIMPDVETDSWTVVTSALQRSLSPSP